LNNKLVNATLTFRHLIFDMRVPLDRVARHIKSVYDGLRLIKLIEPLLSVHLLSKKLITLPDIVVGKKNTLVMDLDETLVRSCHWKNDNPTVVV